MRPSSSQESEQRDSEREVRKRCDFRVAQQDLTAKVEVVMRTRILRQYQKAFSGEKSCWASQYMSAMYPHLIIMIHDNAFSLYK